MILSFSGNIIFQAKMSQSQDGGVDNGEQRSDEEEEDDVLGEDFEAAYSRAQKEFTREAITNSCCIFVFVFLYFCIFVF